MSEREKLIELLQNWGNKVNDGVSVPPVKIGLFLK